ncbi:hypothetical protein [Nocardioides stalactiti]|uniref:hypothetical protein n=1 Tax=Nocardioides stalactiti TaxID=2755356 RepID=UPI0016045ACD|nr:hypothetical protein [Nocardioides stalactiti]
MNAWVEGAVLLACAAAALLFVVDLVRDRNTLDSHFVALAVVEVAVLVHAVWAGVDLAGADIDGSDQAKVISYLGAMAIGPVLGAYFGLIERSRAGTFSMLLAVATVAALEARVIDIWSTLV